MKNFYLPMAFSGEVMKELMKDTFGLIGQSPKPRTYEATYEARNYYISIFSPCGAAERLLKGLSSFRLWPGCSSNMSLSSFLVSEKNQRCKRNLVPTVKMALAVKHDHCAVTQTQRGDVAKQTP
jgi:hypothetical protein